MQRGSGQQQLLLAYHSGAKNIFDLLDTASVNWSLAGENLAESRDVDRVQPATLEGPL